MHYNANDHLFLFYVWVCLSDLHTTALNDLNYLYVNNISLI